MIIPDSDGRPVGDLEEAWSDAARQAAALARAARAQLKTMKAQRSAILQKMLIHIGNDQIMNHGKFIMTPRSKAHWVQANDLSSQITRLEQHRIPRPFYAKFRKQLRRAFT